MMRFQRDPLAVLEGLLEVQKEALRSGDLTALTGLAPRLEKAVSDLERRSVQSTGVPRAGGADPTRLAKVKAAAEYNASLLSSACASVARAVPGLRGNGRVQLSTYGRDGQVQQTGGDGGRTLSRR